MTKDDALRMIDIMDRLVTLLFIYSKDLEASVYHELDVVQDNIRDFYYHIKDGD